MAVSAARRALGLWRCGHFYANNVAFRRRLFLATGFPESRTFRGQCVALARRLDRGGVILVQRADARIAHPAPNGWRHFVARALCEGHDLAIGGEPPSWSVSWRRSSRRFADARARIRANGAKVGLGRWSALGALALAFAYYTFRLAGERIALRRPDWIRKYFPV